MACGRLVHLCVIAPCILGVTAYWHAPNLVNMPGAALCLLCCKPESDFCIDASSRSEEHIVSWYAAYRIDCLQSCLLVRIRLCSSL